MTAGKIILSFKGNNNNYLCGNPKIDFWKKSYQRYTNFSMQSIELDCEDKITPKIDEDTVYRFKIHRYADLINYIYLTIDLPTIYSNHEEFKWIDNIGCSILNYARLYHNSSCIEEIDGKYLYIFNQLYNDSNSKKYFDKLVGNISELNDPYLNGIYNSYSKISHELSNDIDNVIFPYKNYNNKPSIENYQLNIPLIFSCFKNNNNLPLISLSKTDVYIEVSLKSIRKLYTIVSNQDIIIKKPCPSIRDYWNYDDTNILGTVSFKKKKRHIDTGNFSRFTSNMILYPEFNYLTMKPKLNANYIFLDNKERTLFGNLAIENLEVLKDHIDFFNLKGLNHLNTQLYHPIKNFILLAQRDDVHYRNEWMNFTNLDSKHCNPLNNQNQILDYAQTEANYNNDELFKYLGSFINFESSEEQTIISDHNITTNFYDNGLINNVIVNKSGDYFTKVPNIKLENIDNILTTNLQTNVTFNLQHAIIYNHGEYKSVPTYNTITNNGNSLDSQIKLSVKDDKLYSVDVLNKGSNYDNIIEISLNKTYNIDEIAITNHGNNYLSNPYIFIYPTPKAGYSRDNISDLNISNAEFSSTILDSKINSISIDNIGYNYNNEITDFKVYIGGKLDLTTPINQSSNNSMSFTEIPNIYFHDGYSEIIKPIIDVDISSGVLDCSISSLQYNNGGNYGITGNQGYGLSSKTKVRTGKVIDIISEKVVTNDFKIKGNKGPDKYVTPKLKFLPNEYITTHNIDKGIKDNIFSSNTFIEPNIIPILSGDSKGYDTDIKIVFYDNIIYKGNGEIDFNGSVNDNVVKYPIFNNVQLTSNSSGQFINNSLILDYDLIGNVNTTNGAIPNNIIYNNVDTAVFYLHYAESLNEPIYSSLNLQLKTEHLIPNHSIAPNNIDNILTLLPSVNFDKLPVKILKDNVIIKNVDITGEFDGFKVLNYTDTITDDSRTGLLFYISNTSLNNYTNALNIYEKVGEIFKLFINNIFIDAVEIKNQEYTVHKGMNYRDLINSSEIGVSSNNNRLLLLFGNFEKELFSIEIGKKIRSFITENEGYGFKNTPSVGITNANGINKLDFRSVVYPNCGVGIDDDDAEFHPILDYGGQDADYDLEVAFGGTSKNLKEFIKLTKITSTKKLNLTFNENYYGDNVYDNIFNNVIYANNTAIFNTFGSDNIFINYNEPPYMFLKHTNPNVYIRNDYEDIIVQGVLDYGGTEGEIKIDIDYGGTGGVFNVLKNENITTDSDNIYYNINISESGIGYKATEDNVSYLLGTLIKYNKYRIEKATIVRQYNLKTSNGLIIPYDTLSVAATENADNKLYLGSRINGDSIVDTNGNYTNNFRGICFVVDDDDGQNSSFIPHPNINYTDGYDRVKIAKNILSETDEEKDKLAFIVGGIVDTKPTIVNKGKNYGTKLDDINNGNISDSSIFKNLKNLDVNPHIYSTVYNSYSNSTENIVRFSEDTEISIRTSINDNFELDDCIVDIITQPKYIVTQEASSTSNSGASYNTSQFSLTSIEQRHYGLTPWDNQAFDLYFFDDYFYLYKSQIFNLFSIQIEELLLDQGLSNTIGNLTNPVLDNIFMSNGPFGSSFNKIIAHAPYWSSVHGEQLKGYDSPRQINSVQIISSDFNDSPGNYTDYVKFTLDSNIPTPSDFGIQNQGYIYPLDPNQFDVLRGEYIYFTDNVDYIINGIPTNTPTTTTTTNTIILNNKLPLIKFDLDTDSFSRIIPSSSLGTQLTSFYIRNNPLSESDITFPNESLIDNYVDEQNDNVIIYNNLINKINQINTGIGYYKDNREKDILVCDISDGNTDLYLKPIIDDDAEPAKIEVTFNETDEDGLATIKHVTLKVNDNGPMQGKDYKEAPEIYFIDFYDNNKIYEFGVFSTIDDSIGYVHDVFTIEDSFKVPPRAIPYIGGKITSLELYNYYKIPIRTKTKNQELLTYLNNIKNFLKIDDVFEEDYLSNYIEPYYLFNSKLKIGGNITSILLLKNGENYTQKPKIYASYKTDKKYVLDTSFSVDEEVDSIPTYNNVNGRIESLIDSDYIPCSVTANVLSEKNDKFTLISKNVHDINSKISNGGDLRSILTINTPDTLKYNYNYTKYSNVDIGVSIDSFIIDDIGSEIDDSCNFSIIIEQSIDNDDIYYYNYPKYIYNLQFKGRNISTKNIELSPNIINSGNGYGSSADIAIHTGSGGQILALCGIDNIIIDNIGHSYSNNSIIIESGSNDIISDTYKWKSIDKSLLFDSQEYFTYDYIKNFNQNWIYRDSEDIPQINDKSIAKLYDNDIITSLEIFINNKNREYISNIDLFKKLEKYEFWSNSNNNELNVYSFSLDNNSNNPNGACNFSSFKDIKFKVNIKDMKPYENYKYNLSIYFEYFNVKQYMNGIGAIKFGN